MQSSQLSTTNAASVAISTAVRAPESDTLSMVDSGIMGSRLSLITVSTEVGSLWDVVRSTNQLQDRRFQKHPKQVPVSCI